MAMKFTHTPESRPLDGYTIKRPLHRGGFGEVYFAVTDGGRDVALKLLRENVEVELRGVQQCLNLSHPNLVTIFDIKQDGDGDYWIVMEFVPGDTLDEALRRENRPLPMEEVLRWMRGLCSGVSHLHERGLVHRDLKPSNIFSAEGVVKVGDIGLSKFITASRRSAHTESVGTVYYMAPEISRGRYGKEVDIYALGIIAFEMATGQIPFDGESAGEILMKHLTQPPNLAILPDRLRPVIGKALSKDPARRQRSAHEFLREFEAAVVGRQAVRAPRTVAEWVEPVEPLERYEPEAPTNWVPWVAVGLLGLAALVGGGGPLLLMSLLFIVVMGVFGWTSRDLGRITGRVRRSWVGRTSIDDRPLPVARPAQYIPPYPWYGHWSVLVLIVGGLLFSLQAGLTATSMVALGGMSLIGTALLVKTFTFGYETLCLLMGAPLRRPVAAPVRPVAMASPKAVLPTPLRPTQERLGALVTSGFFAPLSVAALTAAIAGVRPDFFQIQSGLSLLTVFVAVATIACWAIALVSTLGEGQGWDHWTRRGMFAAAGMGTGATAYAVWTSLFKPGGDLFSSLGQDQAFVNFGSHALIDAGGAPSLAGFMCFFGFWFGIVNWLKQTNCLRMSRLSMGSALLSVIVAAGTSMIFAFPIEMALLWSGVISASVQLTSPGLVPMRKA
ncbi:MAG: serine/threonine protein kinase [Planctomycetota bacterium]|nr:MAG: serine/threonine protein kinase [Planctomycetota bacterium]